MDVSVDSAKLGTALEEAAAAVERVPLENADLRRHRDRYATEIREARAGIVDEKRNWAVIDKVSATTMYVLGDVNLLCSGER